VGEGFERRTRVEAERIAAKVARELGIDGRRVKANVVMEEAMRYKPRMGSDEEANKEAVKITYEIPGGRDEVIPAAESNASIVKGLRDRALVILNVYYVPEKQEQTAEIRRKESRIRESYQEFVSRHFQARSLDCGCEKGPHMCQIMQEADGIEKVRKLSKKPKYFCKKCGRVSSVKRYLCEGVGI